MLQGFKLAGRDAGATSTLRAQRGDLQPGAKSNRVNVGTTAAVRFDMRMGTCG